MVAALGGRGCVGSKGQAGILTTNDDLKEAAHDVRVEVSRGGEGLFFPDALVLEVAEKIRDRIFEAALDKVRAELILY